jgi:serine protease Do
MYRAVTIALMLIPGLSQAEPSPELVMALKASVVKVHTATKTGGQGVGTGVVVSQDHIATSCHVLANASGITIRKFGESHAPVAMKADWKHDICLLKFQGLPLTPVAFGDSEKLAYEQPIFTLGFPGGGPKPQLTTGKIKALYALDDSQIVRTSASFRMGASGSPVLDEQGRLIAINTFKSPGRDAFFYNIPSKWVKALLEAPEITTPQQEDVPFWAAPEDVRPYFMRVVPPLQAQNWSELERLSRAWTVSDPGSAEAWYHLALAYQGQGNAEQASAHFHKALTLNHQHAGSLQQLAMQASRDGDREGVELARLALNRIDADLVEELDQAVGGIR